MQKCQLPPIQQLACVRMNFCFLYGHVVDEFSEQATHYEFQVTIKQGYTLEASGLKIHDRGSLIG